MNKKIGYLAAGVAIVSGLYLEGCSRPILRQIDETERQLVKLEQNTLQYQQASEKLRKLKRRAACEAYGVQYNSRECNMVARELEFLESGGVVPQLPPELQKKKAELERYLTKWKNKDLPEIREEAVQRNTGILRGYATKEIEQGINETKDAVEHEGQRAKATIELPAPEGVSAPVADPNRIFSRSPAQTQPANTNMCEKTNSIALEAQGLVQGCQEPIFIETTCHMCLGGIGKEKSENNPYGFDVYCFDGMDGNLKKYKNVGKYHTCRELPQMDTKYALMTYLYDDSQKKITHTMDKNGMKVPLLETYTFYDAVKALEERINRQTVTQPQPLQVGE